MRYHIPALLLALLPSAAFAQNDAKVPDPDPELERKTFVVAPGFEVNLFAADPLLAKPIQMNFDPQGRLWVATSELYPQIKPGEKANDKIIILEDTKGVGKADKTTVFADGLLIPTGIEPGDGGAYVANSTEIVHLSASKPGEKADKKRILLSGFGTEDTHHIIHTFRWGPDCHLYFDQSVYIHSHIETPTGVKVLNAGGIWRFNPDKTELDVFVRGFWNPWGHAFDKYGQSFITDGANGEGITHGVPGAYYPAATGPNMQRTGYPGAYTMHGLNPGSPKHCGLEIISGRHFPDDWQGDCITNDFRGHRVCRFKLSEDGSSFASREMTEVIKSDHPAFRPIDVKMGPDGALYIADWYNPIIQHGEVDFRDPRRDHTHGRIWRVTAKNRPLVPKPKLVDATIPELLEQLKSPEQWTRQQAKRVLKERGEEKVLPELKKWVKGLDEKDVDYPHRLLEAMWVCDAFGLYSPRQEEETKTQSRNRSVAADLVFELTYSLKDSAPRTCAPAIRTMYGEGGLAAWGINKPFLWLLRDKNPLVRLEAVRALAKCSADEAPFAAYVALGLLDLPMDRTLDYALWLTLRELEPYWMQKFLSGEETFDGDAKKIAFALNAVGNKDAVKPVVALIESGKVAKENVHGLHLLLAQIGGPEELGKVLTYAGADGTSATQRTELLAAIAATVQARRISSPKGVEQLLEKAVGEPGRAGQLAARLAGLWKVEPLRLALVRGSTTTKLDAADHAARFEALALFGDKDAKDFITSRCDVAFKPEVRRLAIAALAGLDMPTAAAKAAEFLVAAKPEPELLDLYAAFLSRKAGVPALAKALAGKKLPPEVAKLGLQAVRASTLNVPELADALTKAGDLAAARKPPTADEVKAMVADAAKADPARGEVIFRRRELQCFACHGIGGAGGQVGPDMTSIGASAQPDYLVESLLLPSKAIKEGFHAMRVVTIEDKVYLGIKVREADGLLVLRTAEDKEVTIPVKEIVERPQAMKSLMPEGLTDTLTKQEFADLVSFLTQLGKIGPYSPSKARLVRRWQVIEPTSANLDAFRVTRVSAATEPDKQFVWSPTYSMVSGDLPLASLPKFSVWANTAEQTVLRFNLDVTTAGSVKLKINSVAGLSLYVGAVPVEPKAETLLDLKTGVQTVTLIIDRSKRTEDVRIELDDVAGSPARVSVLGGK
jgi:putative heme-binding domain-containing protein